MTGKGTADKQQEVTKGHGKIEEPKRLHVTKTTKISVRQHRCVEFTVKIGVD